MVLKRTDVGKILYPKGTTKKNRCLWRRMFESVSVSIKNYKNIFIACSGGIDSTVLSHIAAQSIHLNPQNVFKQTYNIQLLYINHNLRKNEIVEEKIFVNNLSKSLFKRDALIFDLDLKKGPSLQERARNLRREIFSSLLEEKYIVLCAHQANDNAETKLFQFIKGRSVNGIPASNQLNDRAIILRPLLKFSRQDIETYAKCWHLEWKEDSSNNSNLYTRNFIRHELIPLIQIINPSFVSTLL